MLARRIVVVCNAAEVATTLASAFAIAGCVLEVVRTPAELTADQLVDTLCVLAVDPATPGALADVLARLSGDARAMIVVARSSLVTTLEWLAASARVVAVVAVDALEDATLSTLAAAILDGESLRLEHVLAATDEVHTHLIENEHAKRECLARLAERVAQIGAPTRLQRATEQTCDELVSNALYAAPVAADGRRLFEELSIAERVRYQVDAQVTARFGGDATRFALSVRDEFGSLRRATALQFLHKGAHATDKVDRKLSGAGLGLYLLASECSAMYVHIEHGIGTEITCVFELDASRPELRQFALVSTEGDPVEVTARARSRDARLRPARTRAPVKTWLLRAALAVMIAGIAGVGAWRFSRSTDGTMSLAVTTEPVGATMLVDGRPIATSRSPVVISGLRPGIPILITADHPGYVGRRLVVLPREGQVALSIALRHVAATLDIDSTPPGATALLDGKRVGETPVVVTDLPIGHDITVTLQREGFSDAVVRRAVPPAGSRFEITEHLTPANGYAAVHIDSTPPGARIVDPSGKLGTQPVFTPADLVLSTSDEHLLVLTMSHHLPASLAPFKAEVGLSRTAVLRPVAVIQVEADRAASATIVDVAHCRALEVPGECPVSPGSYQVEIRVAGQPVVRRTVLVNEQDVVVRYEQPPN